MWSAEASVVTCASVEAVWRLWTDVERWPAWDQDVEWCRLERSFDVGSRGTLKPRGGPAVKFEVLWLEAHRGFTDRSFLPFTTLDFVHTMERVDGGVRITHRIVFSGPLSFLFRRVLGKKLATGLPVAVEKLAQLAEQALRC